MSDLRRLLEAHAAGVEPDPEALQQVRRGARRRRRRRRGLAGLATLVVAFTVIGVLKLPGVERPPDDGAVRISAAQAALRGPVPARKLRQHLGIRGVTKGSPEDVVVPDTSTGASSTSASLALVEMPAGIPSALPDGTRHASVAPGGGAVAAVTGKGVVVVTPGLSTPSGGAGLNPSRGPTGAGRGAADHDHVTVRAAGATAAVSWSRGGTALFVRASGGWVVVTNPATMPAAFLVAHALAVPKLPGGPTFLSVSPGGDFALLFGLTGGPSDPVPHLYLGRFQGQRVMDVHPLFTPPTSVAGPLGWLGDNAFLLSAGAGRAIIYRIGGAPIQVGAGAIPNPCRTSIRLACGPWLLGASSDGSLLFWRVDPAPRFASSRSNEVQTGACYYYSTWLNGTHPALLTGAAARYGPPLAAR